MNKTTLNNIYLGWKPRVKQLPDTLSFCIINKQGDVKFLDYLEKTYNVEDIKLAPEGKLSQHPFFIHLATKYGTENFSVKELLQLQTIFQSSQRAKYYLEQARKNKMESELSK